jgi:hypothetical protein
LDYGLEGATNITPTPAKNEVFFGGKINKFWIVASYILLYQTVLLLFYGGL